VENSNSQQQQQEQKQSIDHNQKLEEEQQRQELEEERNCMQRILSKMALPKVSDIEACSALIRLTAPECNQQEFDINPLEFKYELLLSDSRDGKFKLVYSGDATEIMLKDLKPAIEYHLRVSSLLDDLKGELTKAVSFKTLTCEPDCPSPPKLATRSKTSLQLKWSATETNGSKITSYVLEWDQGQGNMHFTELYNGINKQYKVARLSASNGYTFRLAAVNSIGRSEYSDAVCYYTSGSTPSQPDPPMMSEQFVKALIISWIKRPNDDEFTLQMEDEATGHGFLTVYNGPDLSYKIKNLRRNTEYKFRLSANNEEGNSKWSDFINYNTLPDRPQAPPKPQIKGKVHSSQFKVTWDPPKDNGGADITSYILEVDDGRGYEVAYNNKEREYSCDHLLPGHLYRVRVACLSTGGQSEWSEFLAMTTQAVVPGICNAPKLQGKPRANSLHLRWNYPEYNGGAQVTDFEILMSLPDNSTREVYKGRDLDCVVAGLQPGRPYLFQVRAYNKAGVGLWSESLEVVSGPGVPDPPQTLQVHCKSAHSAVISWDEPVNNGATIIGYRLEWQQKLDAEFTQLYFGSAQQYEIRGLSPATLYSFRVQAVNSAGAGPLSSIGACSTPPSSPGAVVSLRATAMTTSIQLQWKEPICNGSEILSYNIDLGERQLSVNQIQENLVEELQPETTYRIRVQAVNAIGVGAYSAPVKVTTRSLPPQPPKIECMNCNHNSLKLKWGEGKNLELVQYVLEMMKETGSYCAIYHGSNHSHKISKLSEMTEYEFRIHAVNEAGDGPHSDIFKFKTTKAPPPGVKSPKVHNVSLEWCEIEWQSSQPMGKDNIIYSLQVQNIFAKDMEYKQIYKGSETKFRLEGLTPKTEYCVRVCAIRQCSDSSGDLIGAYSPGTLFTTQGPKLPSSSTSHRASRSECQRPTEPRQLSDEQWAVILLLGFTVIAVVIATLAQQVIAYSNSGSDTPPTPE